MTVRLGAMLDNVRTAVPLVHNITNYVTVNDCANILLACGASPIMTADVGEVEEIVSIAAALNLNIGTMEERKISAMFLAGKTALQLGRPVVLDPVGAGASALRKRTSRALMREVRPTVVRGNMSEIKSLALETSTSRGVDADAVDAVTPETLDKAVAFVKNFARENNCIVAVTGAIDIVADGQSAFCIFNGNPMMSKVTGTGCQLSAMCAAFVAANPCDKLTATAAAVCTMGVCGERADARMKFMRDLAAREARDGVKVSALTPGNISYRDYIIDAVANLTGEDLEREARYELR